MTMDADFWKSRYELEETGWNIGAVSTPVKEYLDQLTDKTIRILIPGCGFGYEAMYAYSAGFTNVFVLDFVAEPLDVFRRNCSDFPEDQIIQGDFFTHLEKYDLILEQTLFCAIDPAMREAYASQVKSLLKPEGKLAGVLFDRTFENNPPFGGSAAEYKELFAKYFRNVYIADCYNSIPQRQGTEVFIRCS